MGSVSLKSYSSMTENFLANSNHNMLFKDLKILSSSLHFMTWLQWETVRMHKHRFNINQKQENLRLNKAWYPEFFMDLRLWLEESRRLAMKWIELWFAIDQSEARLGQKLYVGRPGQINNHQWAMNTSTEGGGSFCRTDYGLTAQKNNFTNTDSCECLV